VLRLLVLVEGIEVIGIEILDMDRSAPPRCAGSFAADRNPPDSSAQPRIPSADMLLQALGTGIRQRNGLIRHTQAHAKSTT
jgi:hypothetical protein